MQTELFNGTFKALKDRLDALIAQPKTINNVIPLKGGTYLILFT